MRDISDMLGTPVVDKGVGSSVHNDFIAPLTEAVLGAEWAAALHDKYRKIQAVIEQLGGTYVPADPLVRGSGHTSEGTTSGGGGTLTNFGLETIRDLLLANGVPSAERPDGPSVRDLLDEGFSPNQVSEDRRKRLQEVATRPGATKFRNQVRSAYGNRCCITGADELAALDVAHIANYIGPESDAVGNALLLRADIHKLHDALLLAVSDEDLTVLIKPRLLGTTYEQFAGTTISEPNGYVLSGEALRHHRERCGI